MTAVLELDEVTRIHGTGPAEVTALRAVSFTAYAGELVAVMGPSGSGKSTLLTLAGGLDRPTSGAVRVEGTDLAVLGQKGRAAMRRTSIGYVFQDFNLIPALTAVENVALPRELDGSGSRSARKAAMAALDEVGIAVLARRFPDEMSGGQQQRVAIARAMATRCCWPPDISSGKRSARSPMPTSSSAAQAAAIAGRRRSPSSSRGRATFSAAVRAGIRLKSWKT